MVDVVVVVVIVTTVKTEYANEGIAADVDHRRLRAFLSIALPFARVLALGWGPNSCKVAKYFGCMGMECGWFAQ
jgi:hypothetical protein